jgi:hypothetical protein
MPRPVKNKALVVRATRATRHGVWVSGRSLVDEVSAAALRLPIRDQQTLRRQFPGQSPDQIAHTLIRASARSTGAVGAMLNITGRHLPPAPTTPPPRLDTQTRTTEARIQLELAAGSRHGELTGESNDCDDI